MAKNLPPKKETQKVVEIEENDNWVEEDGEILSDEEFETVLHTAPLADEQSKPLREILTHLGINLDSEDD